MFECWGWVGVWMGVGCPCPPVCNDIVTPRHLFFIPSLDYAFFHFFYSGLPLILNSSLKCFVYAASDRDFRKHWRRFWAFCFAFFTPRRRNGGSNERKCCQRSLRSRFASSSSSSFSSSSSSSSPYLITLVREQKTKGGVTLPSIVVEFVEADV